MSLPPPYESLLVVVLIQIQSDGLRNVGQHFFHSLALRKAPWQVWDFCPVSAFFRFMNEHLQCHASTLLHRPIPRKTDLCLLLASSSSLLSFSSRLFVKVDRVVPSR